MIIIRDGFEFELTPAELAQAYREVQLKEDMQTIRELFEQMEKPEDVFRSEGAYDEFLVYAAREMRSYVNDFEDGDVRYEAISAAKSAIASAKDAPYEEAKERTADSGLEARRRAYQRNQLKSWIAGGGLEEQIQRYDVQPGEQHAQRWGTLFDYVEMRGLDAVKPHLADIVERYEAGEDVAEFIDKSWLMWHSAPLDTLDDSIVGKWRVHLVMPGDRYGLNDCLTYDPANAKAGNNLPLVEFYDTSQDESRFPGGQFVSRYYMSTLLGLDGLSTSESIAEIASRNGSLSLQGDVPVWTVSSSELSVIARRLEKAHEAIVQKDSHEDAADLDVERASAKGACRDVNEPSAPGRDDLEIGC